MATLDAQAQPVVAAWDPFAAMRVDYPATGIELKRGWFMTQGAPSTSVCIDGQKMLSELKEMDASFTEVTLREQLYRALSINAAARYGVARASASFLDAQSSDRSTWGVMSVVKIRAGGEYLGPDDKGRMPLRADRLKGLREAGEKGERRAKVNALRAFFNECGDSYVTAIEKGASLATKFNVVASKERRDKIISGGVSGGFGRFKASLSVSQELKASLEQASTTIQQVQSGGVLKLADDAKVALTQAMSFPANLGDTKEEAEKRAAPLAILIVPYEAHPDFPDSMRGLRTPPPYISYLAALAHQFEDLSSDYRAALFSRAGYQFPFQQVNLNSPLCAAIPASDPKRIDKCLANELADAVRMTATLAQVVREMVFWCRGDAVCDLDDIPVGSDLAWWWNEAKVAGALKEQPQEAWAQPLAATAADDFAKRMIGLLRGPKRDDDPNDQKPRFDVDGITAHYLKYLAEAPLPQPSASGEQGGIAEAVSICTRSTNGAGCTHELNNRAADYIVNMQQSLRQWVLEERLGKAVAGGCSMDPSHPLCMSTTSAMRAHDLLHVSFGDPRRFASAGTGLSEFLCSRLHLGPINSDGPAPHITRQAV